ncbi:MAG: hypothetical protein ACK45Y_05295, partial [Betaproteobacteria bacterium]
MIFLIEYDRQSGSLVQLLAFQDTQADLARAARAELELDRMQSNVEREIVTLEAESEEDLRKTHRRYFEPIGTLA